MTDPTIHMTGFIVIVAVLGIGAHCWRCWCSNILCIRGLSGAVFQVLSGVATALAAAVILGIGGGCLLGKAFIRGYTPEFLKAPLTLLSYGLANQAQIETKKPPPVAVGA